MGTRTLLWANFEFFDLHYAAKIKKKRSIRDSWVSFYAIGLATLKRIEGIWQAVVRSRRVI